MKKVHTKGHIYSIQKSVIVFSADFEDIKKPDFRIKSGFIVSWQWDSNPQPADYKGTILSFIHFSYVCKSLICKELWRV